jgi:8-oxo-dGTP pyrophosphatase MutT (NUDIX family)
MRNVMEKLDVYDKKRNKTGRIIFRDEDVLFNDNEFIVALRGWVINNDNKILFTRRSLNKTQPGKWEPTGGLLISGETSLEGIKRELSEEIGLTVLD